MFARPATITTSRRRWSAPALAAALMLTTACTAGCGQMLGAIVYFLSPPQVRKAEFELTQARLAIHIDSRGQSRNNPLFEHELHQTLSEVFKEKKLNARIVPHERMLDLQQRNADFAKWSNQKIGRELRVEQVLYIMIDELRTRERPDHPILHPRVWLRARVVGVQAPSAHPVLWPIDEPAGREISTARQPQEAGDINRDDTAIAKLARDAAHLIASYFYDLDLEDGPPKER